MKAPPNSRAASAFTLFEMIIVVTIFVLLAGGIFTTVSTAVRATAAVSEETERTERLSALISLLRETFHNLPATAILTGGVDNQNGDAVPQIVLRDAPGAFAWGRGGPSAGTAVLAARPQLGGAKAISLILLPGSLGEQQRREALNGGAWLRLLPELRDARWRFFNEEQQDWLEELPEGSPRPPMVELNLEILGEDIPRKYVFWLPPVSEQQAATGGTPNPSPGPVPVPTPQP